MDAGQLDKKIVIQNLVESKDDDGNRIDNWLDFQTAWASVNGLSGNAFWSASVMQAENTIEFTIRYSKKLECLSVKGYRIMFKGSNYEINHIDNVQFANEILKIKAVCKGG